jgi:WD40 repeat protein
VSKIFISHASADNAAALALAQWLDREGWNGQYFLDLSQDAIAPGERWEMALRAAARRCEAVILLLSRAWLSSTWCHDEMRLARHLGKQLIGVLIDAEITIDDVPDVLKRESQLCFLTTASDKILFQVGTPTIPTTQVEMSSSGLDRLKLGLERAGLSAEAFPWPPENDPDRSPYRGLKPLEEQDAAVLFGRDAELLDAVGQLRVMRDSLTESNFIIVGASGAGKSSFLRAGLLPRLRRDTQRFLIAPIVRPRRSVIEGPDGLIASLDALHREYNTAISRATIREQVLASPEGLRGVIGNLQRKLSGLEDSAGPPPTLIFPIDQGEELFAPDGLKEAKRLFELIQLEAQREVGPTPRAGATSGLAVITPFILVFTIRSDSYGKLQDEEALGSLPRRLFDLAPVSPSHYQSIIEGPARRVRQAGGKLEMDPYLSRELLNDAVGADAVPLLAYTLEQLHIEHAGDGILKLDDYSALGRMQGVLDSAVNAAFAEPASAPAIPESASQRLAMLRQAFIPHLVDLSEDNQPVRRTAPWTEIPAPARPLIERLVNQRLLVRDRRQVASNSVDIIEVAHESLLRHWHVLTNWLAEETSRIRVLGDARRATARWLDNGRNTDDLVMRGVRLQEAAALLARSDYGPRLRQDHADEFLEACRRHETRLAMDRQRLLRWRNRAVAAALVVLAASTLALARLWNIADQSLFVSGKAWIEQARADLRNDRSYAAYRASGMVLDQGPGATGRQFVPATAPEAVEAQTILEVASLTTPDTLGEYVHETPIYSLDVSPDGALLATGGMGSVTVRRLATSEVVVTLSGHSNQVHRLRFLGSASRLATTDIDGKFGFWDLGGHVGRMECPPSAGHSPYIYALDYSPATGLLAVGDGTGTISLRDGATGQRLQSETRLEEPVISLAFDPTGKMLFAGGQKGTITALAVGTSASSSLAVTGSTSGHDGIVFSIAASSDGREILTAATDKRVRAWTPTLEPRRELPRHATPMWSTSYHNHLGAIVTTARDNVIRLFDIRTGKLIHAIDQHDGWVYKTAAYGSEIISASDDGRVKRFDMRPVLGALSALPSNDDVTTGMFSPDGQWLATGGRDSGETQNVNVWRISSGSILPHCTLKARGTVWQTAFSRDSQALAIASQAGDGITIWDPQTCKQAAALSLPGEDSGFEAIAFSPSTHLLAALPVGTKDGSRIVVFDPASGRVVSRGQEHEGDAKAIAFHPSGNAIATGDASGKLVVWKLSSEPQPALSVQFRSTLGHYIKSLSFSPDGKRLARGGDQGDLLFYDFEAMDLAPAKLELHKGMINAVTFSPDGQMVAAGADDARLSIWNTTTLKPIRNLAALTGIWGPFGFHPKLPWLAFDGGEGIVRVWDMSALVRRPATRRPAEAGRVHPLSPPATLSATCTAR